MAYPYEFQGTIELLDMESGYHVIRLPAEVIQRLPFNKGSKLRVEGEIDEIPFQRALHKEKQGYYLLISKRFMKEAGLNFGDPAEVSFRIADPNSIEIPAEILARLDSDKEFKRAWESISVGKRRSHCHQVAIAKMEETKERRVEQVVELVMEESSK